MVRRRMNGRMPSATHLELVAARDAAAREHVEPWQAPQEARVEELEERAELAEVVLDRRAGERQPVARLQQAARLGGLRRRVLDRLRFVEDDGVEVDRGQEADVAPQRAVGRHDDVELVHLGLQLLAVGAAVLDHLQLRGEVRRLLDPVVDHAPRGDDERRQLGRLGGRAVGLQQGEHLHRLAEAHVVGQHAAEAELAQEVEPAEPLALIAAQLAAEALELSLRLDALEGLELVAQVGEGAIDVGRRHGRQQRIDEQGLRGQEAQAVVAGAVGEVGERVVGLHPVRGQQSPRAVVELEEAVAAGDGPEHGRQVDPVAAEVDLAAELEPVDAALHLERGRIRADARSCRALRRPNPRPVEARSRPAGRRG